MFLAMPIREYRGQSALCAGVQGRQRTAGVKGQRPLGGYRAAAPVRSVEAASLYSGVQRWKTSAQGKLMPASTCTGYYLTQISASVAASLRQICSANEKKLWKTAKELLKKNQIN